MIELRVFSGFAAGRDGFRLTNQVPGSGDALQ